MTRLSDYEPKLHANFFRRWLIKIHRDLFSIHRKIQKWSAYYPNELTQLEILTLVLEDRRFLAHQGVDSRSIIRELLRAITFRRHGGASTIDMQFVRTCTGYKERTLRRKAYEIFLATIIQFRYSKIVILRSYLACAFFGSHLIGADKAAKKIYQKSANELSTDEAAFIASMLVYPRPLRPNDEWTSRVERRASYGKRIHITNPKRFEKLPS